MDNINREKELQEAKIRAYILLLCMEFIDSLDGICWNKIK